MKYLRYLLAFLVSPLLILATILVVWPIKNQKDENKIK